MEIIENESNRVLKKHVNTIHCSNNLTLVQRKLFNVLLYHAYHDLPEKSQYEISVKRLCHLIGYDSRDYKKLKKSIMDLIVTAIEWNVIAQENGVHKEKWQSSSIVSAAKIENGVCTYEFSSIMRELLHQPEIYGKIDIGIMTKFKSSYGLALYENCIRFQSISKTPWLPIQVFRKLMGISDQSYQKYCDLKKRVVDVAVGEVNKYSPIKVTPEIKRISNKVTNIKFNLSKENADAITAEQNDAQAQHELIFIIEQDMGLRPELAKELMVKYGAMYIDEKIKLIKNSDSYKSGKIREISAYFIDALRKDYKIGKTTNEYNIDNSLKQQKKQKHEENQYQEKKKNRETDKKTVQEYFNKLAKEEQNYIILQFEKHLKEKDSFFLYKKYKKAGLENKIVKACFDSFILDLIKIDQSECQTFA